ncbi:type VII toxin-antitoxin system MntA family adenylyltransferase antitoxin [Salinibius halmophilus]|uniref:type VII toxin-antitoxin system MntA family adenylyltransferase antitoxin n=1 Tax=Salinibius halmophilus TaxID=1853216 RepID=UPI000E66DB03|nr:nucleotidyltransferase domain-containing protein [Salinibius halmophilus]
MDIQQQCLQLAEADDNIVALWLYGSRAKGTESEHSDYDLAVAFDSFIEDELERRLRPETLALEWQQELGLAEFTLSIADIDHVPLPLAYSIITTGKLLYSSNGLRVARTENKITSMWEVDYQYHRKHYG